MKPQRWTAADLAEKGYAEVLGKWGKNGSAGRSLQVKSKRVVPYGASAAPSLFQQFFIPGPMPGMNDIVRKQHFIYSAMKRKWNRTIGLCMTQAHLKPMQRVSVAFTWVERNTKRDPDNIIAAQKFILDCLVVNGVLPEDGWANIAGLSHAFQIDATNPGVWVELQEVPR